MLKNLNFWFKSQKNILIFDSVTRKVILGEGVLKICIFRAWNIGGVGQKFCVAPLFSPCGYTAVLKLCTHVTEGIPSIHAKFCGNWLKITQR